MKVRHLKRYKEVAYLLFKYGRSDLVHSLKHDIDLPKNEEPLKDEQEKRKQIVNDLEAMGPTFVKLGQLLSTQTDLLPEVYAEEMSKLQDKAKPFPFEQVEQIFQQEFHADTHDLFQQFDKEPIAAASLSQVHQAVLPSGRIVAVKVQRPGIEKSIVDDFEVLEEIASLIDKKNTHYGYVDAIRKLKNTLINELDFLKEAINMNNMRKNLENFPSIRIPTPVEDYTTSRILTMDYISGTKITTLSPLVKMDIQGKALIEELFKSYNKQIFLDGLVHVDPHPGNVYLTDTQQIVLFDLGMVERISPRMQNTLLKLFLAISEGAGEEAADIISKIGFHGAHFEIQKLRDEVSELVSFYHNLNLSQLALGRVLMKMARKAGECGIRLPPIFNMLGKTLLNLDKIAKTLAPDFNPNQIIKDDAYALVMDRIKKNFTWSGFYRIGLEGLEFLQKIPSQINDLFEILSKNQLHLKIKSSDEKRFLYAIERLANRIALGLVLAALIVGAALLMRIQTSFTLFGYPGIAILLFLGAAIGGILFVLSILFSDHKED